MCRLLAGLPSAWLPCWVHGSPLPSSPASHSRLGRGVSEFLALCASYLCSLSSGAKERARFYFPCISSLSHRPSSTCSQGSRLGAGPQMHECGQCD